MPELLGRPSRTPQILDRPKDTREWVEAALKARRTTRVNKFVEFSPHRISKLMILLSTDSKYLKNKKYVKN
jgi:hypothetical protein